jgi:hypothetical protein
MSILYPLDRAVRILRDVNSLLESEIPEVVTPLLRQGRRHAVCFITLTLPFLWQFRLEFSQLG